MALERIGINFSSRRLAGELAFAEDLEELKATSPDWRNRRIGGSRKSRKTVRLPTRHEQFEIDFAFSQSAR